MQVANQWLEQVKDILCKKIFNEPILGERCHISYGFPSSGAFSKTRQVGGEAWQQDGKEAIFINPVLFKQEHLYTLCAALIHELIHIKIGIQAKHGKAFKQEMVAMGLDGKPTYSHPSEMLITNLKTMNLPVLPELQLQKVEAEKKQTTRLILLECACGRKLRMSKATIEEGSIVCGKCREDFKEKEPYKI